jgi:large subunit ribosomal protein L6
MSMTDPIADLLTRIRNAHRAKHDRLDVPASNVKLEVCRLLKDAGYIKNVTVIEEQPRNLIRIYLSYTKEGKPGISRMRRVSSPGRRVYRGADDMPGTRAARRWRAALRGLVGGCVMSRIGRKPIPVPAGVKVRVEDGVLRAEGPKGKVAQKLAPGIGVVANDNQLELTRGDDERKSRALHGLMRALVANAVEGVAKGFAKSLDVVGVGYRAEVKGRELHLALGFSHPVVFAIPAGIDIDVEKNTRINVRGADRQQVGQVAAEIRGLRSPDPYKGKGVRYSDERLKLKVGKAGGK